MARALRIEYPGAFYHVMHRGNAGTDIYKNDMDRETFLEYLGKSVARYELKIHTYCLKIFCLLYVTSLIVIMTQFCEKGKRGILPGMWLFILAVK